MADISPTTTLKYKTVGDDLDIQLDVYLPPNASHVPVLLWFHGGGLLQGHRNQLAPHMRRAVSTHNLAVVSADYRFAPQTRLPEIFQDVKDCVHFIRNNLASRLPSKDAVDVSRLAVSGSSAGGYLALLAGLYCSPKPTCLLPIYPITDPLGSYFTTPQPPPSFRPHLASHADLAACLDTNTKAVANCGPLGEDERMNMYVRMMADANLASLLGISDPRTAGPWRVSRNVYAEGLPPTYVIHGDADESVGVEQADEVVGAVVGCAGGEDGDVQEGKVVYERVRGGNHFLDVGEGYANERMYGWLMRQLKGGDAADGMES